MGWSYGHANGREVGYAVPATCDQEGCETAIDRGLAYCMRALACGGCGNADPDKRCIGCLHDFGACWDCLQPACRCDSTCGQPPTAPVVPGAEGRVSDG